MRVLSPLDWQCWITFGYVVIKQAAPAENVARLVKTLWEFDEKDAADPTSWYTPQRREYKHKELNNIGMLEIYNHQALWDNRMEPRIYDSFVDIWDREDLWVSIDRANLCPPEKNGSDSKGFIHWDVDTSLNPLPVGVQGILSLSVQNAEVGGFQCVPSLFQDFDEWLKRQPKGRESRCPDLSGYDVLSIDLEPGDLLIFNSLLAHGVRPNLSENQVRLSQFISMSPAQPDNVQEREERIRLWAERDHPQRSAFPGDPREWESRHFEEAKLTPLGKKLLGISPWS